MSDETTLGPAFPLRDRIGAALTTACSEHSHCNRMGPAVWAVVQPELDQRDAEITKLREGKAKLGQTIAAFPDAHKAANLAHARARRDAAEATIARVRAVLDQKDLDLDKVELTSLLPLRRRVLISEIRAALDPPAPVESDLPAVREFVAGFGPCKEALPDGYLAAAMRRAVEQMAQDVQRRMDGGPK